MSRRCQHPAAPPELVDLLGPHRPGSLRVAPLAHYKQRLGARQPGVIDLRASLALPVDNLVAGVPMTARPGPEKLQRSMVGPGAVVTQYVPVR